MNILHTITQYAAWFSTIVAALVIIVKPFREKLFDTKKIKDGQKCLLRERMLSIYYKHLDEKKLHQYEYENFLYLYKAYKALGGNSFIDKIKLEVDTWTIVY